MDIEQDLNQANTLSELNQNGNDTQTLAMDSDSQLGKKKLKYPKSVFFIVTNEFCERFSYYGMRTILAIYLQNMLHFSENDATIIYHTFVSFCYFFPLLGAIIADCYLGKFKTIFSLSIIYALGNIVLSVASDVDLPINNIVFSLIGLFLIALGTGGIKPCVSSFGGDQFVLPQQEKQLVSFFSIFYFSINAGSLISTFLTPILRTEACLGRDTCYPLAFGIPAILMITSLLIFLSGKRLYKIRKPEGNIVIDVSQCISRAVWRKITVKEKKDHWLDYADDKHSNKLIAETKVLMEIIYLLSPTILFWALYEQQGSRWTFQATHMNGQLWRYTIMPDQMQVVNPVLILVFIPLFESIVYPILAKLHLIRTSLQKLSVGGVIAAIAFVISAIVEFQLEPSYAVLPSTGEAQLRIYNSYSCPALIDIPEESLQSSLKATGLLEMKSISVTGQKDLVVQVSFSADSCPGAQHLLNTTIKIYEKKAISYVLVVGSNNQTNLISLRNYDDLSKTDDAQPKVRVVYNLLNNQTLKIIGKDNETKIQMTLSATTNATDPFTISSGSYFLVLNNTKISQQYELEVGGVYSILVAEERNGTVETGLFVLTPPNSVHILWLLPQIIIITVAEIMFSITGLEFCFTQAPVSMKSVVSSLWLLTDAIGNVIVVIISEATADIRQAYVLLLFAGLMLIVMGIFILLAIRFKYPPEEVTVDKETTNNLVDDSVLTEKQETRNYLKDNPGFIMESDQ